MPSDISLSSAALVMLGANAINSFSDAGAGAQVATALYEDTYKMVLATHPWTFALKLQTLSKLSEVPDTITNWSTIFQNPTDLIKYWWIKPLSNYEMIGDKVYSNQNELLAQYVFKVAESQLPPHFSKALEYKLASEFAVGVTDERSKQEFFQGMYKDAVAQARGIDSQSHPQVPIVDTPFTDVRGFGNSSRSGSGFF